jgi:hypothetical protein
MDLVIDSSGLAIFGEGEWAAAKHGGKGIRGWKKLHLGVDGDGVIVTPQTPAVPFCLPRNGPANPIG